MVLNIHCDFFFYSGWPSPQQSEKSPLEENKLEMCIALSVMRNESHGREKNNKSSHFSLRVARPTT